MCVPRVPGRRRGRAGQQRAVQLRQLQTADGAPFGWSVYFQDDDVRRIQGPLAVLDGHGKRWFCSKCGSTLFWRSFGAWRPGQTGFAGGGFADPTLPVPTIAVRCAQGMPWIAYPDGCAVFDDMPPVAPPSSP